METLADLESQNSSLKNLVKIKNAQIKSLNQELLSESHQEGTAQRIVELAKKVCLIFS